MALSPIAFIAPNFRDFSTWWLKAYEPGTTTPKTMALDSEGVTTVAKLELNADGFLESAGGALVIPYIDGAYDAWLFPTEAEADANDTVNAERVADNITGVNGNLIANAVVIKFDDLDSAKSETNPVIMYEGATINLKVRSSDNIDSGGMCDVVSSLTVSPNGFDIIAHDTLPLAIVIRLDDAQVPIDRLGAIGDKLFDNSPVLQRAFNIAIERGYEVLIGAGTYLMNSQVNLDEAKGLINFQFKLRGVGYSSNYLENDSKCNLVANVATLGTTTPLILLDVTDIPSGNNPRFTATLTDFNITSTGGAAFAGIAMKHCWYTFERLGIKGHINGYHCTESYRGSLNKCAITGNVNNIMFAGYNSVQTITDNQLRAASANMITFDPDYVPDTTTTAVNQFRQSVISGNNMESTPTVLDLTNADNSSGITLIDSYSEAGDTMVDAVGCVINFFKFRGSSIGYAFKFDEAQEIDIDCLQGSLQTTDNSINVEFNRKDAFAGVIGQDNKQNPAALTSDSLLNFTGRFSLDNGASFLPPEYRNTTVGGQDISWAASTPYYPLKEYLHFEMNGSTIVRLDLALNPLHTEVIPGVGYRVRASITLRTNTLDTVEIKAREFGGSFSTVANVTGTNGSWVTISFTVDVANTARGLAISLNSGVAIDLDLDSFIVALRTNPVIHAPELARKYLTIPALSSVVVSNEHNIICEFQPDDSVADISITGQQGVNVTITNNDNVDRQGLVTARPQYGY